jgi:cytidyltransferase-like protein
MTTILLFGTFDGIHDGHRFCFSSAKNLADKLVVAVAQDDIVKRLKGRAPKLNLDERISALKQETLVDQVVAGDLELGSYESVVSVKPDIVGVGYDQRELETDLAKWIAANSKKIKIVRLESFKPDKFKSSKLNLKKI